MKFTIKELFLITTIVAVAIVVGQGISEYITYDIHYYLNTNDNPNPTLKK